MQKHRVCAQATSDAPEDMAQREERKSLQHRIGEVAVDNDTISYVRRRLMTWGRMHVEHFPWRTATNKFHTLIAEILLQRTKASQVVSTYLKFTERYPDPASLAGACIPEVEDVIRPLGLKWRAKLLIQLGQALEGFEWEVPDDQQALMRLPGVGAYVSAAYVSLHCGRRAPILDSNIVRFYGRFWGFDTGPETRRNQDVMKLADLMTPRRGFKEFNYALVDFTRTVCVPNPTHQTCCVRNKCCLYTRDLL